MSNEGHIKLHRKIQESAEWTLPAEQIKVMIAILLNANYEQSNVFLDGSARTIFPGQLLTSRETLKRICGKRISEQTIRTSIKNLENTGFLTKEVTKGKHTILTVNNWEIYQAAKKSTNKLTDDQPTTNQRLTRSKEGKEGKELKDLKPLVVFDHWNAQKNTIHHKKLTDRMISKLNSKFADGYTEAEICEAIDNYDFVIGSPKHFFTYKWTLEDFITRSNGFVCFTNQAAPRFNFLKDKSAVVSAQNKPRPVIVPPPPKETPEEAEARKAMNAEKIKQLAEGIRMS
jgi:hypothetical protein